MKKKVENVIWTIIIALGGYLLIGLFSIYQIIHGENLPYMPFWHAPWKWLIDIGGR